VVATALIPTAILFESAVTFLGFGLPQGEPSWGADLGGQTRTFFQTAPWLAIFPGIALCLTILAFNLLGDALRDELDPRLRNRG
jgi:peptide/nickel transport system permease protein